MRGEFVVGAMLGLVALAGACAGDESEDPAGCAALCAGGVGASGSAADATAGAGGAAGTTVAGADTSGATGASSSERAPGTAGAAPIPDSAGTMPASNAGAAGVTGGSAAAAGQGGMAIEGGCGQTLPPIADYGADGPFAPMTINNTGPDGQYTMVRPATLGEGGFLHPVATWGNGITTTPALYPQLLNAIASHGFVVIASNSTTVNAQLMTAGLDWLIAQNDVAGDFQGKLDVDCAVTIGYSLGGGGAVNAGAHPDVVATVSFHGLQGAAEALHGPLLLFTSTADGFVTKAGYVQPCYDRSSVVPTILATLDIPGAPADFAGHLYPVGGAGEERAPAIAWLRLWVYGDAGARAYFYGADCTLCASPWTDLQRKNADWE